MLRQTFLNMLFRDVAPMRDAVTIKESTLWFYVDLVLLLSIAGLGAWIFREWRPRRKRVKEEDKVYISTLR